MSVELLACEKYIKAVLLQSGLLPAGTGIWGTVVPEGQPLPAVLVSRQSSVDTNGGGGERLLTRPVYYIRGVVDETCQDALGPIAAAIDAAFRLTAETPPSYIDGVIVRGANRTQSMIGDTVENGVVYTYCGGLYEIFCYLDSTGQSSGTVIITAPGSAIQAQIDALTRRIDEMAYSPTVAAIPSVPVTATVTLALPTQDTRYPVNITANAVITLPAAPGGGRKLYFDFDSLATFSCTFALNGSDSYITPLPSAVTGASFALVSNTVGKWSIE